MECRICLETAGDKLIAPCSCNGTAKFVHEQCLATWRRIGSRIDVDVDFRALEKLGAAEIAVNAVEDMGRTFVDVAIQASYLISRLAHFGDRDALVKLEAGEIVDACLYVFGKKNEDMRYAGCLAIERLVEGDRAYAKKLEARGVIETLRSLKGPEARDALRKFNVA